MSVISNVLFLTTLYLFSISIAPAADCTDEPKDYTFYRTKYNDGERGNRHLDGFVDCQSLYYVEDYNITGESDEQLYSCFAPGGLCLTLTSSDNDGWWYSVYNMKRGNNNIDNQRKLYFKTFLQS